MTDNVQPVEQWEEGSNEPDDDGMYTVWLHDAATGEDIPVAETYTKETMQQIASDHKRIVVLEQALDYIAMPATRAMIGGGIQCLRCGFETYLEKDGEVQHEKTCVQQYAMRVLGEVMENNHAE
jgi:hypothetical protein